MPTTPHHIPTIGQASAMNALAYQAEGEVGDRSGWRRAHDYPCPRSGCHIVRWEHPSGTMYISVRGTSNRRDVMDNVRIFLGKAPRTRIKALRNYIKEHCREALTNNRLYVGGHSMGGMIAMGAAARWGLPGLVQNAPGWLANAPTDEKLGQLVEIRTGRDVVGAWGSNVPHTLVLHDPQTPALDIRTLHSLHRQMELIQTHELTNIPLDRLHAQLQHEATLGAPRQDHGTLGWMRETWRQINHDRRSQPRP